MNKVYIIVKTHRYKDAEFLDHSRAEIIDVYDAENEACEAAAHLAYKEMPERADEYKYAVPYVPRCDGYSVRINEDETLAEVLCDGEVEYSFSVVEKIVKPFFDYHDYE